MSSDSLLIFWTLGKFFAHLCPSSTTRFASTAFSVHGRHGRSQPHLYITTHDPGHPEASLKKPRFKSRATIQFFGACDWSRKAPTKFGSCITMAARILPRMGRRKQPSRPFLQANPQIFGDHQPGACVREKVKRLMKHNIPVDSKSLPLSYSIKPAKLPHGIARHSAHDRSSYRSPPPYCWNRSRILPTLSTNDDTQVAAVMPLHSPYAWRACWAILQTKTSGWLPATSVNTREDTRKDTNAHS